MSYKPFTTEYTWQIIDDIKEYLEETNKDQTTLDTLDLCHLIGEIEKTNDRSRELFNENKQLKFQLQQKENIIKEAKEYVYKMFNIEPANSREYDYHCGKLAEILDKDSNEENK